MRLTRGLVTVCLVGSCTLHAQATGWQTSDPAKVSAYLRTLPAETAAPFSEPQQETLAASAISCADHLQEPPINRNDYLWRYAKTPQLLDDYLHVRAFYGCGNWHDAVASDWMLMSLLNGNPKIGIASDVKDIAATHFKQKNLDGEYEFFSSEHVPPGGNGYEKPYGYAWLLKLYGEVKAGSLPQDKAMAKVLAPLAKWMSERYVFYLYDLKFPYRTGTETNTAWGMSLALDGANLSEDETLKAAVHVNAVRLFGKDEHCAANFEPQNSDLVSSCLTEAALMGRVMAQADYLKWLDNYLPPVSSDAFQGYARAVDVSHTSLSGPDKEVQESAQAHLVALNFQRAASMLTIAYALPKDDPRVPVLRNLAIAAARHGYEKINLDGYEGAHLIPVYAALYESAMKGPAPLAPPPKPKKSDDETTEGN